LVEIKAIIIILISSHQGAFKEQEGDED
jgi:hypothetical protein